jgi:hypothetical protein
MELIMNRYPEIGEFVVTSSDKVLLVLGYSNKRYFRGVYMYCTMPVDTTNEAVVNVIKKFLLDMTETIFSSGANNSLLITGMDTYAKLDYDGSDAIKEARGIIPDFKIDTSRCKRWYTKMKMLSKNSYFSTELHEKEYYNKKVEASKVELKEQIKQTKKKLGVVNGKSIQYGVCYRNMSSKRKYYVYYGQNTNTFEYVFGEITGKYQLERLDEWLKTRNTAKSLEWINIIALKKIPANLENKNSLSELLLPDMFDSRSIKDRVVELLNRKDSVM